MNKKATDQTPSSAFNLRLSPELKRALVRAAAENGRSLNGEIGYRLRMSLTSYRQ